MAITETTTPAEVIRARIGDGWRDAEDVQEVRDPYRGGVVAGSPISSKQDCDDAGAELVLTKAHCDGSSLGRYGVRRRIGRPNATCRTRADALERGLWRQ